MKTKFIAIGVAAVSFLALGSCMNRASADYSTTRQITKIDANVSTALNLFYDSSKPEEDYNGQLLDTEVKNGAYYHLYVAKDATASLFTYNWDMTTYFSSEDGKRNSNVTVSTLSFAIQKADALYDEEKTAILTQAYSTDKGVKNKLNVDFTISASTDYTKEFKTNGAYTAFENGEKVSLAIVYMPVYVVHFVSDQPVLRNYVFLPIYTTFVTESGKEVNATGELVDSKISGISCVNLDEFFDSTNKNLLKAAEDVVEPEEPKEPEKKEESQGLPAGAIVGIVLGSVALGLVLIYFLVGFTLYRNGTLNGAFFKAIYKWIKRPTNLRKK